MRLTLISFRRAAMAAAVFAVFADPAHAQNPDIPLHAKVASYGVILGLRGAGASPDGLPATLSSEARKTLASPDFGYEGFLVHSIHVEGLARVKDSDNRWRLLGLVIFEDMVRRRVYTEFAAYYDTDDTQVTIDWATARTRMPETPAIIWFVADPDEFTAADLAPKSHVDLLNLASERSLETASGGEGNYAIYAVSMDRFPADAETVFHSSDDEARVTTFNFGGWPAAVFESRIAANQIGTGETYTVMTPGNDTISKLTDFPGGLLRTE